MLTKSVRPLVFNGPSSWLFALRPISMSSALFQGAKSKASKSGTDEGLFLFDRDVSDLDEKSLAEQKSEEKVLRVEHSLKDLSSVQWRTEFNGKRLWPHDQWPERDLANYPPYHLKAQPNAVRWYCVPESWFKFFYEKTGVTGPYMFFYGLLVYGFSREYIVLWYDFTEYLILAAAVITVVKK